jgi:multidrug resistance efflux pump
MAILRIDKVPHEAAPTAVPEDGGRVSRDLPVPRCTAPGRWVRLVAGLGLIGLPAWFLAPRLWTVSSTRGIVNGSFIRLNAPIDGIVTLAPPDVMQPVEAGEALVRIEAAVIDRRQVDELQAEAGRLTERVAALRDRIQGTRALQQELIARGRRYQESMVAKVTRECEEARLTTSAAAITRDHRAFEARQEKTLVDRGFGSLRDLARARMDARVARLEADRARAAAARLEQQLESIRGGVFTGPGDSRNDVPYSQQRLHEVDLQILRDESEAREDAARLAEVHKQIGAEEERLRRRSSARLDAPTGGVVWTRSVAVGSPVTAGAEVLRMVDRSTLFVDALLSGRSIDEVRPGDPAIIRPLGSTAAIAGRVRCIAGESPIERSTAFELPRIDRNQVHVIIDPLRDASGGGTPEALPLGQRVEVDFPEGARSAMRLR